MAWTNCFETINIPGQGNAASDVATIGCLEPLFVSLVNAVVALAGIALFITLVTSGFTYLFSAGDPKKLEQAQHTMTNAIIGLVVIACAYLILLIIRAFTGIDVTKFQIFTFK